MTTVCIVQARMTSTRLPGKVLLPLGGEPMLGRQLERLRRARTLDGIVVATTTNAADDAIAALCGAADVPCFRGSEHDVLSRYAGAARMAGAGTVVRVTSDCPLIDPAVIDEVVAAYRAGDCDYASNTHPQTWPHGMAVEVFSRAALDQAQAEARASDEREHVTPFLYWRPERFRLRNVRRSPDLSFHRWTVDTPEDYELVGKLFDAVSARRADFTLADVLEALARHPEWAAINSHVQQRVPARPEDVKESDT
jgi:spore coat polysaccharide biosynthesis protein SpsF